MGKRNKERIIPFGEELSEMIAKYRNLRDTTVGGLPTERFFVRPTDSPCTEGLSTGSYTELWRDAR